MTDFLRVSYQLDAATVERVVTQRSPGTYVLGHKRTGSMFMIALVGRADNNLNVRLKQTRRCACLLGVHVPVLRHRQGGVRSRVHGVPHLCAARQQGASDPSAKRGLEMS
jgi:hypothetical protein